MVTFNLVFILYLSQVIKDRNISIILYLLKRLLITALFILIKFIIIEQIIFNIYSELSLSSLIIFSKLEIKKYISSSAK